MALKLGSLFWDIGADTKGLKKAEAEVGKTTKKMGKSFSRLGAIITAALSFEAARRVIMIADNMKLMEARVRRLTGSQKEFNKTMDGLVRVSSEAGTKIADTIQQFQRFKIAAEGIGATNEQTVTFVETFQKLGLLAGSTSAEIANTGIQLGQGLAAGALRGDELRSVLEQMPELSKIIAKELGALPSQLKKLGEQGRITSDIVFKSLLNQAENINEQFKELPVTIDRAGNQAANAFALAVSEVDKLSGGTEAIAQLIVTQLLPLIESIPDGFLVASNAIDEMKAALDDAVDITLDADASAFALKTTWEKVFDAVKFVARAIIDLPQNIKGAATIIIGEFDQVRLFIVGLTTVVSNEFNEMFLSAKGLGTVITREFKLAFSFIGSEVEKMKSAVLGIFDNDEEEAARATRLRQILRDSGTHRAEIRNTTKAVLQGFEEQKAAGRDIVDDTLDNVGREREARQTIINETLNDIRAEKDARKSAFEESLALRRKQRAEAKADRERDRAEQGPRGDTTGITPVAQVTDPEAFAKMLAQLGTETDQIIQAFVDRQAKIFEITAEGDERRRELQIANAERLGEDLNIIVKANELAAQGIIDGALGNLNAAFRAAGKEGTAIAKASFLAQRAIQVVQILAATEVAAANAAAVAAIGGPQAFFATSGVIRATGRISAGIVAGLSISEATGGGRQFGGTVSPQLAHPINEAGTPEILSQAGKQFLLPNGQGGTVTPLGKSTGGQGSINVTLISNGTPQTVERTELTKGGVQIMINDAVRQSENKTNTSLATGRGDTAQSLRQGFDLQRNIR